LGKLKLGMKIFKSIFGGAKPDSRDMDQLIFDLAEHGNRPSDLRELYRRLPKLEIFAKVRSANFPLEKGSRHVIAPGEDLHIQTVLLPNGQSFAEFFVDRADPRLGQQFIGMSPRAACEMVLKGDNLAGLRIRNSRNSWIALLKPELQRLLQKELALPASSNAGSPPPVK
jgi:hypothetical protein